MKVFLPGATGFIGSSIALALQRAGHSVMGLARSDKSMQKLLDRGMLVRRGDLSMTDLLVHSAEESQAIIYATAASDASERDAIAISAMLEKFAGTGKSFIYTAGVWDLGDTHGKPVDEKSPFDPVPLVSWRPKVSQMVLDAASRDIQTAVIMPSIVYGNGGGIPAMLVNSAREEGAARIVGDGENHWSFVHVDDLADLYVRCLQAPPGTMLIGSANHPYKVREVAEAASRGAGAEGRVTLWPVEEARQKLGAFADALTIDTPVKADRARKLLGWQPIGPSIIDELESGSYVEGR